LQIKGDEVTLDDLKKALKLNWRLKNKSVESDNGDEDKESEVALTLTENVICERCSKTGHIANNCWAKLSKSVLPVIEMGKKDIMVSTEAMAKNVDSKENVTTVVR